MKYWQSSKLSDPKFKRLYGVFNLTIKRKVRLVKAQKKFKKKSGRPPKIIIKKQALIVLQYWR